MRKGKGFSLIELLVVVAIMGILAGIAIPSFLGYRMRARNAAALSDGASFRVVEESFFLARGTYTGSTICLCEFSFEPANVQGSQVFIPSLTGVAAAKYTVNFQHAKGDMKAIATQSGLTQNSCNGSCGGSTVWDQPTGGCPPQNLTC